MKSFWKRVPWRSKEYLEYVRSLPCMHCGAPPPSEAHHWHPTDKGKGLKCPDWATTPLCGPCHRGGWHQKGSLPGLTPELSKQDFIREQWRLMGDWISGKDG